MKAVHVAGLKKTYFGRSVLEDVSLDLEQGKFYALIGQNGAGKSTLMRILNHIEAPETGQGSVMGLELTGDPADFGLRVGYVCEAITYPSWTSIGKFFDGLKSLYPKWDQTLFDRVAKDFGFDLNAPFGTLSRGLRMQACLSFVLAISPGLLLLDEVTAVLDARARSLAMRLFREFVDEGGTVVMATNIVSETHHVADSLIYLENKRVRLVAPVEQVSSQFVKLRKMRGAQHRVFELPDCVELRIGDDDSVVCLIPVSSAPGDLPDELKYPGLATSEDVFIYYTQMAQREQQ